MGGIVSAVFGGGGGGGASAPAVPPQSQYDPYGAIGGRTDAANQLQALMKDPSMALSQPGYQMTLGQGTSALTAQGAAKGTIQSGAQAAALQGYGQNIFNSYYNQLYNQLGTLSGATTQSPASATSAQYNNQVQAAALQNQIQQQNAQTGIFTTLLAGNALASSGIFGGGGGGASTGLGGYTSEQIAAGANSAVDPAVAAEYMAMFA